MNRKLKVLNDPEADALLIKSGEYTSTTKQNQSKSKS